MGNFDPSEFGLNWNDLTQESILQEVIDAAGGKVAGRIRLQKLVYLLDKMGLDSGFEFSYYHYGPYAADLSDAVDFSKAFDLIREDIAHRTSDGAQYSVFSVELPKDRSIRSEFFDREDVKEAIGLMNIASSTVLELAATAFWLRNDERTADWREEIVRRKGTKTEGGRLAKAETLLKQLRLLEQ